MALDAAMIAVTARELSEKLTGARVDKIYMPARDEALFALRTKEGACRLLLSARSGSARAHLTEEEYEFPAVPPSFCMLLRKHLQGGRVLNIVGAPDERVMLFTLEALNEMGDRVTITVSLELMGRYSNLVLVNQQGRVIDALKRIDEDQSDKRQLYPGIPFTMPPSQGKPGFLAEGAEDLAHRVRASEKPLSQAVLDAVAGIGPVVCREIAHRVDPADGPASGLDDAGAQRLRFVIGQVQAAAQGEGTALAIVYDGDKPVEYSFIDLTQYAGLRREAYDSPGRLLERYYGERDRAERMKARSFDLSRQVHALYDRAVRKQAARLEERDNTARANEKRLFGELINANVHCIEKGQKSVRLLNYYTGEEIDIPLDATRTPVQNAQKYFKEYRKLTTAATMLEKLLRETEEEIAYLDAVKYEITEARSEEDFLLIRKELKDAGYLRGFRYKEQKKPRKTAAFLTYRTSDGLRVLVGRNNAANEKLTLRTAEKRDIWFHVKDAAGSHTVLMTQGEPAPDRSMTQAAEIAAFHSSAAGSSGVAVDYTAIKNVRKAAGQKMGMVIYDNYKTAYVTPDRARVEALREGKED